MHHTLENNAIVIVGGGSIGLSTALNLAKRMHGTTDNVAIKVIEIANKTFPAASLSCTGCFHYGFTDTKFQPLLPLGKYSFELWAAEAGNPYFSQVTGYRAQSSFAVNLGSGHKLDELPDWVKQNPSWDVDTQVLGDHTATVNPQGIGMWLTEECLRLGVEICTDLQVVEASVAKDNQIQSVTCIKENQTTIRIGCNKLLLACGPWTPTVYKKLFPSSPISLDWTTDAGDWITLKNPCPTAKSTTAFVSFANLVNAKMEFAARNDGSIWACGRRDLTSPLPTPTQAAEPDEKVVKELIGYADTWINWNCTCADAHDQFQLIAKGKAFRPTTKTALPVISEVPSSSLCENTGNASVDSICSSGVFICWGHGSYGLTLGLGSGRLMSQLMLGLTPDIDISPFALDKNCTRTNVKEAAKKGLTLNPFTWLRIVWN